MEFGWNVLWFIIGVSLLVTVHEFGHFWVARKLGFKVLRFSVGFGKPLFKKVGAAPDHTEYVIAAIPLGGYVRMLDERDGAVEPADRAARFRQPAALAAHPGVAGRSRGQHPVRDPGAVGHVLASTASQHVKAGRSARWTRDRSPASAGLRAGDEIRSINGDADPRPDRCSARVVRRRQRRGPGQHRGARQGRQRAHRDARSSRIPKARRKLTEPMQLDRGLGFQFWQPRFPPCWEV